MADTKHDKADVAICSQAQGSLAFFLEKNCYKDAPPITHNNIVNFYMGGESGFMQLLEDLNHAKETIDICCWGFDPGMELDRTGNKWPRGETYGQLLEKLASRKENPVTVRLLIWFDSVASFASNTMPGYTDDRQTLVMNTDPSLVQNISQTISYYHGGGGDPYNNPDRHEYCKNWWKRNLPWYPVSNDSNGKGNSGAKLQVVLRGINRDIHSSDITEMLTSVDPVEQDQPADTMFNPVSESRLLHGHPSHHQKPVLIDYNHDGGSKAVGYVMGLNSVTDYWDTIRHEIDDPKREGLTKAGMEDEVAHDFTSDFCDERDPLGSAPGFSEKQAKTHTANFQHLMPFADYACRIQGEALQQIHNNFETAWNGVAPSTWKTKAKKSDPLPAKIVPAVLNDFDLLAPYKPAYKLQRSSFSVQIVRTQPVEKEKTIKQLYFQATSKARDFIYMENQYFFYPEFARHLKDKRQAYYDTWAAANKKPISPIPMLHLFVVIPLPEDDGMIPRVFDTVTELGNSDTMPNQVNYVKSGQIDQVYHDSKDEACPGTMGVQTTHKVLHRASVADLQKAMGLKVSIGRLCTSGLVGGKMAYREIYIHSKLMIIDDVFITLGSANISQRSMSVDSEINIAATEPEKLPNFRNSIFSNHAGSDSAINWSGPSAMRGALPDVFSRWNDLMEQNYNTKQEGKSLLRGFIVKFVDMRKGSMMRG